jgi:hypothetical protein
MKKIEKMRQQYITGRYVSYLCDFYSCDLQPVDHDMVIMVAKYKNEEPDFTPKPGMYSENFSGKLTNQMILEAINKLFNEHGRFCLNQGEISRENWKAWFCMVYPHIYKYKTQEYYIGFDNKRLRDIRKKAELIWANNLVD